MKFIPLANDRFLQCNVAAKRNGYHFIITMSGHGHPSRSLITRNNQTTVYLLHAHPAVIVKETLIVAKSIMLKIEINVSLYSQLIFVSFFFFSRPYHSHTVAFFFFCS